VGEAPPFSSLGGGACACGAGFSVVVLFPTQPVLATRYSLLNPVLDLDSAPLDLVEEGLRRDVPLLQHGAAFLDRPRGQPSELSERIYETNSRRLSRR
jgi:hypothetical protein